jgi:ligand-binding SRPBCC domain-containing protein
MAFLKFETALSSPVQFVYMGPTFTISDTVYISAPIERCFLLATNIELAGKSLGMKPIEGKTSGMIAQDDRLLWAGWKFGLPHMHESHITKFEPPNFFQDTMGRGRFKRYQHDHHFYEMDDRTVLNDKIRFTMPFGVIGRLVGHAVVVPYLSRKLRRRMRMLKRIAENKKEWSKYLPKEPSAA